MQTFARSVFLILVAAVLLLAPSAALADKLYLKDGRVLEGTIEREEEGFVFFVIEVGGIRDSQLFSRDEIDRIEREDKAGAETPARATPDRSRDADARQRAINSGAVKIAFITLGDPPHDQVGPYMNANALKRSVELLEDDEPDIVVLWINSGGGALSEVMPLSDAIEDTIKSKYRVVAWIESAISAAALTANTCEEMYFMSRGNYGAAVAYTQEQGGTTKAVDGPELEQILRMGEEISRRGNRDPLIMRAMQKRIALSCDIDQNGVVTWREDTGGEYIVSREDQILTMNALDAEKYNVSQGIANTKDELARLLGAPEWVEVGQDANDYQVEFRENVARAEVEIGKIMSQMQIALESGQTARARRYIGELRSWARRAPSWTTYSANGAPPLSPEFFRELERLINQSRR